MLDGLSSLVDKSLVQESRGAGEPRFAMLETVREYALEQLDAAARSGTRRAHAAYCLVLAEEGLGLLTVASARSGWSAASASTTTTGPRSIT